MKYSKHSMNQKSNKTFKSTCKDKEGVFETPQGKWMVRVYFKPTGRSNQHYKTVGQYLTKEEAEKVYDSYILR